MKGLTLIQIKFEEFSWTQWSKPSTERLSKGWRVGEFLTTGLDNQINEKMYQLRYKPSLLPINKQIV